MNWRAVRTLLVVGALLSVAQVGAPCYAGPVWVVDGVAVGGAGAGASGGVDPDTVSYPVFHLDLGDGWTDFELKASTNNFAGLLYWTQSAAAHEEAPAEDSGIRIFFTDSGAADGRVYQLAENDAALAGQVAGECGDVMVIPSTNYVGAADWMYEGNDALVWVWIKVDAAGNRETDGSGHEVWRIPERPAWRRRVVAP